MKTVVIVGSLYAYNGPEAEVWGVSRAIKHRGNPLTRYYFMDDMRAHRAGEWAQEHLREIGKLKVNSFPVITSTMYPEFLTAEAYDLDGALEYFGFEYYTCSICYMLADAIRMGYEKIIIHRIHEQKWATDYVTQKAGLDFWCAVALGKGILIEISEDSALCSPYFWMAERYGYGQSDEEIELYDKTTKILVAAVKEIADLTGVDYRPRPTTLIPLFEKKR